MQVHEVSSVAPVTAELFPVAQPVHVVAELAPTAAEYVETAQSVQMETPAMLE